MRGESLAIAAVLAAALTAQPADTRPPAGGGEAVAAAADPLEARGYRATTGAAAGYVADRVCGACHQDLFASFQQVGMARSFARPARARPIEDFDAAPYFHAPSGRYYEMVRRDGGLVFRRYQLDAAGQPIHRLEQGVDWILGSGHRSRVYLFRTPGGELYQLPLAWYTQGGYWAMAPGFDRPDHDGVTRRVRRECMFCHNAYPEVPEGSDGHWESPAFPADLPEGIGCQRCHGPGAAHARIALSGDFAPGELSASIVNPGSLPPAQRDDVCFECHLQPSVALFGVRRFDRGDYSFRPGEPLPDYLVHVDVDEEGQERSDRFEINHHPYRLRQSRCYQESGDRLSCLTCHDPHRKVPVAERPARYRAACRSCHQPEACGREPGESRAGDAARAHDADDCVACHMPQRRTQDVVHVVMTDHLIRRRPGGPELLAPLEESDPVLTGVDLLDPARAPGGALGELYRAVAAVRGAPTATTVGYLESRLLEVSPAEPVPYLDLASAQLKQRRFGAAIETLEGIRHRFPAETLATEWLGIAHAAEDRLDEALPLLQGSAAEHPERPETRFNLGLVLGRLKRYAEAARELEESLRLRPVQPPAWVFLGTAYEALDRPDEAAASYRRALEIEPGYGRAYLALANLLLRRGDRGEAERLLRHGVRWARRPEALSELLAETEAVPR